MAEAWARCRCWSSSKGQFLSCGYRSPFCSGRQFTMRSLVPFLLILGLASCTRKARPATTLPGPEAMGAFLKAKTGWLVREPRQALSWYRKVLDRDPGCCRARSDAASALAVLGRLSEARSLLRATPRSCRRVLFERARLAAIQADRTGAVTLIERLVRRAKTAEDWTGIARLWRMLQHDARERRSLTKALSVTSDHLEALERLFWWHRRKGQFHRAAGVLDRIAAVHPEDYRVPIYRASVFLALGQAQRAWGVLARARSQSPADLALAFHVFRLALYQGRRDEAMTVLQSLGAYRGAGFSTFVAQRLFDLGLPGPALTKARQALGMHWSVGAFQTQLKALLALGRPDEALAALEKALASDRSREPLSGLSEALAGWGQCSRALDIYRHQTRWALRDPSCRKGAWLLLERARLEAACGDRARALALEARVRDRCGVASSLGLARSVVLAAVGRSREAAALALRVVAADPDDSVAANQAGYLLTEAGIDLGRARRLLEEAVVADPFSGAVRDSLGWLEFRSGRLHRAWKHLLLARRLLPAEPEVAWHLGATAQALMRRCKDVACRHRYLCLARSWYARALKQGLVPELRARLAAQEKRLSPGNGRCAQEDVR